MFGIEHGSVNAVGNMQDDGDDYEYGMWGSGAEVTCCPKHFAEYHAPLRNVHTVNLYSVHGKKLAHFG